MAKSEWGTKRTCRNCSEPFYDLKKKTIECPKCGAAFDPNPPSRPKRAAPAAKAVEQDVSQVGEAEDSAGAAAPAKGGAAPNAGDAPAGGDTPDGDDEKDDALIEDTSDLGKDDDDVPEVKEHIDSGVEDKN